MPGVGDGRAVGVRVGMAVSDGRGVRVVVGVLVDTGAAVASGVQAEINKIDPITINFVILKQFPLFLRFITDHAQEPLSPGDALFVFDTLWSEAIHDTKDAAALLGL